MKFLYIGQDDRSKIIPYLVLAHLVGSYLEGHQDRAEGE